MIEGLIVAAILAAISVGLSRLDVPVPLWVTLLVALLGGAGGFAWGRVMRIGEDLAGYHAEHLGEALLTLREILAGNFPEISFQDFIERGILAPARFGLSSEPEEEIRLSILELDDSQTFRMTFEAGHGVGRKANFALGMASMAGYAYESGELKWTNDVESDERWRAHPQARTGREYGSLAAMPIIVGDDAVAVLNVLSTDTGAFLKGDLVYIELLGALIGLAWTLRPPAARPDRLPASQESEDSERKGN